MSELFRNRASGYLVEASEQGANTVAFAPQGGGFVSVLDSVAFHRQFMINDEPEIWRQGRVTGDWLSPGLQEGGLWAFISDRHWNGWANPKLLESGAQGLCDDSGGHFTLCHRGGESWIQYLTGDEEIPMRKIPRTTHIHDGVPYRVYDFSGLGWCWGECD